MVSCVPGLSSQHPVGLLSVRSAKSGLENEVKRSARDVPIVWVSSKVYGLHKLKVRSLFLARVPCLPRAERNVRAGARPACRRR
jgi:hypothetical protein